MLYLGLSEKICKERSDGLAIVRTFQPPLHIANPQVRNRVTSGIGSSHFRRGESVT